MPTERKFVRPSDFDILSHLALSIATLPRAFRVEVLLRTDLETAQRDLPPTLGVLEAVGEAVLLRGQADDVEWFARQLARMPWSFEIRSPTTLIDAVRKHANRLLALTA